MFDMNERLRILTELSLTEQFRCPINLTHQLTSLDRQKCHLYTCKELKTRAAETIIYFCQFYEGHMFLKKEQRDSHEIKCRWMNVPGNSTYDSKLNRHIVIKGNPQKTIQNQTQQSHYEYAQKKGLVKQKKYETQLVNENDFIFVRDPIRINLELEQKFKVYQEDLDDKQLILLVDKRDDTQITDSEFPLTNQQIELIPLSDWIALCFQQGLPFNEFFKQNYSISLEQRNKYQENLKNTQINSLIVGVNYFMPSKVLEEIIEKFYPINNYDAYLQYFVQEVRVRVSQDKYQQDFLNCLQQVTQNHPTYKQPSCLVNIEKQNEILVIIPKNNCKQLKDYASQQANLILLGFKIQKIEICDLLNKYNTNPLSQLKIDIEIESNQLSWKTQKNGTDFEVSVNPSRVFIPLSINQVDDQKQIQYYMDQQKCLNELEELDKLITNYQKRILDKTNTISQQRIRTQEGRQQHAAQLIQYQVLNSQQNNYDVILKNEFNKLKKKIRQTQEQNFQKVQQEFESYRSRLQIDIKENIEDSKNIESQIQNSQHSIQKRKENINKLQTRIEKKEKQLITIREEIQQVIVPNNYYDSNDLQFEVSLDILCKACGKNRINIVYMNCNHAILCQTCFTEITRQGVNHCMFCRKQYDKFRHIQWENGFILGETDIIKQ